MSYTYEFPQASPCSAVVIYTRKGNEIDMLVTSRDPSVGEGRSLGAGGFDEVKNAFNRAGEMIDGREETYREMHEELGEKLKQILPYEEFKKRAEYIWDGMVPQDKHPIVHKVVFRAVEVTPEEMDAIMALPPTKEQKGKQLTHFTLNDDPFTPVSTQVVEQALTGFRYSHEVEAAKMWYEGMERKAKARAPSTGPGW